MKVLALVVLVVAVSGMEAGVVKRDVSNLDDLTKMMSVWFENIKTQTQDLIEKVQNGELQAKTDEIFAQVKSQMDPIQGELQEFYSKLTQKA